MPTISIKELLSAQMRNSPNFSGTPKIEGKLIPSVSADGELSVNGNSIAVKTREYILPTAWQTVYYKSNDEFTTEAIQYGMGTNYFQQTSTNVIYVNPAATVTTGTGTFANPYETIPTTIPDDTLILFFESTTYTISSAITITAKNVMFGTCDIDSGERVIDFDRLATITFGEISTVFTHAVAGSSLTFSGIRFTCTSSNAGDRAVAKITNANTTINVEYCKFEAIDGRSSGLPTANSAVLNTIGKIEARYNIFIGCNHNAIIATGSSTRVYCNRFIYATNIVANFDIVTATGAVSFVEISRNFFLAASVNGGSIINTNTSSGLVKIKNNYLFGTPSSSTQVGPTMQTGIKSTFTGGVTTVFDNIVCNTASAINAPAATVYKNIVFAEGTTFTGIIANKAYHNTVVKYDGHGGEAITGTADILGNIIDTASINSSFAIGIKYTTTSTSYTANIIYGATKPVANSAGAVGVLGTNSNVPSKLDCEFRPLNSSPAYMTASGNVIGVMTNKGARQDFSKVGNSGGLFAPTAGLSELSTAIDGKADLASPSFIGNVTINGNQLVQNIMRDFGTETAKTVTGTTKTTAGTYTLPVLKGNSVSHMTMYFVTAGSGSHTVDVTLGGVVLGSFIIASATTSKANMSIMVSNDQLSVIVDSTINGVTTLSTKTINVSNPTTLKIDLSNTDVAGSTTLKGFNVTTS